MNLNEKIRIVGQFVTKPVYKQYSDVLNFKCPFCNEGHSKNLKRGYLIHLSEQGCFYKCFNCDIRDINGKYLSFKKFIEKVSGNKIANHIEEFLNEKPLDFLEVEKKKKEAKHSGEIFEAFNPLTKGTSQKNYLEKRMIPESNVERELIFGFNGNPFICFDRTFKSEKYVEKEVNKWFNDDYLVVPLYDFENDLTGLSFRNLLPGKKRKFFKLTLDNRISFFKRKDFELDKPYIVLEGQFDMLSLSANKQVISTLSAAAFVPEFLQSNAIFLYDNDYANKQVLNIINQRIDSGYKVIIWPCGTREKDLNDLRIHGWNDSDFYKFFKDNCFSGETAKLKLMKSKYNFIKDNEIRTCL